MAQVIIRREKDGREYEVSTSDFRHGKFFLNEKGEFETYADAHFHIVSYADGSEYHEPAARSHAEPPKAEDKP